MKPACSRVCLGCKEPFEANRRNAHHQKYCSAPACRKASKEASQSRWLAKPENRNYYSGPQAVARVQNWQKANPEYRERQKAKRSPALQDNVLPQPPVFQDIVLQQPPVFKDESIQLPDLEEIFAPPIPVALQDFISAQPYVFIGLIAHFFNYTLQDQIVTATRFLQQLGEDIANGRDPDEFSKTGHLFRTAAADSSAVQLGGSAPRTG